MKLKLGFGLLLAATIALCISSFSSVHADSFNQNAIIDDSVFDNTNSMSIAQIATWLNQFPNSCISSNHGFSAPDPTGYSPTLGFTYGGNVGAAQVIYDSASAYGLNPQVLLTTIQKEQSLVTGANGCGTLSYTGAVGYGCPDSGTTHSYSGLDLYSINGVAVTSVSGTCVNTAAKAGFSQQLIHAAWLLKFGEQRSQGNIGWNVQATNSPESGDSWNNSDDPQSCYSGPMTRGTWQLCPNNPATFFDGFTTIDGSSIQIDNGATASLYWYTPHFSGNQNFYNIFTQWFGPTTSLSNGVTMTNIQQPDPTPAQGETVTYSFSLTNSFTEPVTFDAVGVVGRLGSLSGANRDFGWQGPVTLQPNTTQQFTFTSVIHDPGKMYVWPAVLYEGTYVQYNNWGATLTIHAPNLTLSQPLLTSSATVDAGQNITFTATLKNNEPQAINYDAIGIPVKLNGSYNYDAVWVGPGVIGAGQEVALSGTRDIDTAGSYTYWVSDYLGGVYSTIGSVKQFKAVQATPSFSVSGLSFSSTSPVEGQSLGATFKVTNNLPVPITVDAVGAIGRLGTFTGPNRDLGWQGPIQFGAGETKTFTESGNVTEAGTHYYWIGILYKGAYLQYNNWGSTIVSLAPSFSVSGLSFSSTSPAQGQNLSATFTITNNLPVGIDVGAVGVVGRLGTINGANRDLSWQAPVHFNAGQTQTFTESGNVTEAGTHYYWIGILYNGNYLQYNNWGSTIVSH